VYRINVTERMHGIANLAHTNTSSSSNSKKGLPLDALNCVLDSLADADASYVLTARPVQRLIKVTF
jgi:hypothetical protein